MLIFDIVEDIINKLYQVILDRIKNPPPKSYVASLYAGGHAAIARKVLEEANEFCEAAAEDDADHFVHEAADLFFHMLVMLGAKGIHPDAIGEALARRFGIGGIEEKEARKTGGGYATGQR
ncbi:MAG: phosphoribosyl-ATP diphosphatase [Spirochaetota bacterium]|nr:phosphoribosyl-ATP diphosphatase [Spirochaetota bacterium]